MHENNTNRRRPTPQQNPTSRATPTDGDRHRRTRHREPNRPTATDTAAEPDIESRTNRRRTDTAEPDIESRTNRRRADTAEPDIKSRTDRRRADALPTAAAKPAENAAQRTRLFYYRRQYRPTPRPFSALRPVASVLPDFSRAALF